MAAESDDTVNTTQETPETVEPRFEVPKRQIKSVMQLAQWQQSQAYHDIVGFIKTLSAHVKGKPRPSASSASPSSSSADSSSSSPLTTRSPAITAIRSFILQLKAWIDDIPPIKQPMRYGNKAFLTWHARMTAALPDFHAGFLPPDLLARGLGDELAGYMLEAFGSLQRIDYGTGHELNFAAWMCCLVKVGVLGVDDLEAAVFDVFYEYLELMRALQRTYYLEPAGSKGVWGLDDYQFLPFYWGASQLIGHSQYTPSDITNPTIVATAADEYMYFGCIKFICEMKTGPFGEHSPLLYDISGVPLWSKVNKGLIKMYHDEVLAKFPVIQHFLFGSILTLEPQKRE